MRDEDLAAAFGNVLRDRRTAAGLSQEQLAEAADLHRNYISLVERAKNSPSLAAIASLAAALGLQSSELLREAEQRITKK